MPGCRLLLVAVRRHTRVPRAGCGFGNGVSDVVNIVAMSSLCCALCRFAVYVLGLKGKILPPTIDGLLQWSRLFRSHKTFGNYVSYVKLACELEGEDVSVFCHPSLKRAKNAILKRKLLAPRIPTWVGMGLLQRMMTLVIDRPHLKDLLAIFLASYVFLLRLPSEGLPLAAHSAPLGGKPVPILSCTADSVSIWFPSRKNRIWPSTQVRRCWCSKCSLICPVHMLGGFFRNLEPGTQPFKHIGPAQALLALRELLAELQVPDASVYRTHDFRRGHAEDMRCSGHKLCEILAAGDWNSAAFMIYLNKMQLECDAIEEAHAGFSDSDTGSDEP